MYSRLEMFAASGEDFVLQLDDGVIAKLVDGAIGR